MLDVLIAHVASLTTAATSGAYTPQQTIPYAASVALDLDTGAVFEVTLTGVWSAVASMTTSRYYHMATLLLDGRVVVSGGYTSDGSATVATTEVYDPVENTWTTVGSMSETRYLHTAVCLPDGRVLTAGGRNPVRATSELFDPETDTWSVTTGTMGTGRQGHTMSLLADGRVLAAGGTDGSSSLNTAEVFDVATGLWTVTASPMTGARFGAAVVVLGDNVVIAGGFLPDQASSDIFDPNTNTFSSGGDMVGARHDMAAVALTARTALFIGGEDAATATVSTAETYTI